MAEQVRLTRRMADVLTLAAAGLTNAQIAARLGLSARTVKHHLLRAAHRLGTCGERGCGGTRGRSMARAAELGLIPPATGQQVTPAQALAVLSDGHTATHRPGVRCRVCGALAVLHRAVNGAANGRVP